MGKSDKKRIIVKIGSNVLTQGADCISKKKIDDIVCQVASLRDQYDFVIVSSGAIAAAKQLVEPDDNREETVVKQALAAVGQPYLMQLFQEGFGKLGLRISQCLLSYSDLERKQSKTNIINTIQVLLKKGFIPIVNENDTVATEEIKFGDNDILSALIASLLKADILIMATNTDGVGKKRSIDNTFQTIAETSDISLLRGEIKSSVSRHGTGGMITKIEAAEIAQKANIETWIVNGMRDNFILTAINQTTGFTRIIVPAACFTP